MRHELLAPAGSYSVFKAVLAAGADAVYLGGDKYSARAFAPNFSSEEILSAIDLAHLYGRKVYLALNTLLKGKEIGRELYEYLKPFYEEGLDAIIVQDFGVFSFVRKYFPGLPIHVSTQMSVVSYYGAGFLKDQGAVRIVPAREISLDDIRKIYNETGIELECFIHGALCYCYSGDCLMSSLIGERSGNRGRCAQPCRLPYKVVDQNGAEYPGRGLYPLSLKDLCAAELIPKLCEAGVYSFKIEGRMKSLEYAAGVTAIYRKYLDMYESDPANYHVSDEDLNALMALGNRSGFTSGYYEEWSGREMVTPEASAHTAPGIENENKWELPPIPVKGKIKITAGAPAELTVSAADADGPELTIFDADADESELTVSAVDADRSETAAAEVNNLDSESDRTTARRSVTATGPVVQTAKSRPVEADEIQKRIKKTGDTPFAFSMLEAEVGKNSFIPVGQINELRRNVLCQLQEGMLHCFRRTAPEDEEIYNIERTAVVNHADIFAENEHNGRPFLNVVVSDEVQLKTALASPVVDMISLDLGTNDREYFERGVYQSERLLKDIKEVRANIAAAGKKTGFCFPYVFGSEPQEVFDSPDWDDLFSRFDALWVRSYDSLGYCLSHLSERKAKIRLDGSAYVFSGTAYQAFAELDIGGYTVSPELNRGELSHMPNAAAEFPVYGYQPVMITANCLHKNYYGCQKGSADPRNFYLSDRTGRKFFVKRCCRDGLNIIYNSRPLNLLHRADEILGMGFGSYRLSFVTETAEECNNILDTYARAFILGESMDSPADPESFTNGHFRRRVL